MVIPPRILAEAEALFKRKGIRNVTMDDICKELQISEKTLHQYFKNKAEIVHAVSETHFRIERELTTVLLAQAQNPVHGLMLAMAASAKSLQEIPMSMVHDIQKLYPESCKQFQGLREKFVDEIVRKNLQQGVKLGLYRKDMDIDTIAKTRLVQIASTTNEHYFPAAKYDLAKLQMEQFSLFLHGIVSMKGKKLIYQYLNQPEDE